MAKLNFVRMQGLVVRVVDNRSYNGAFFIELSIKRKKSERTDNPIIIVADKESIAKVLEIEPAIKAGENIFMNIEGKISTFNVQMRVICSNGDCKLPFHRQVTKTFVTAKEANFFRTDNPIYINDIFSLGSVVSPVKSEQVGEDNQRTKYKLGLNESSTKADYPYVVSFKEQAVSDKLRLVLKSQVAVKGFFQTRKSPVGCTCPVCSTFSAVEVTTGEIFATGVEYLNKCRFTNDELNEENEYLQIAVSESIKQDYPKDHPIHKQIELIADKLLSRSNFREDVSESPLSQVMSEVRRGG